MANNKKDNTGRNIGVGIGITAAIAAAVGSYFLYGTKNAAKNRAAVKSWALKAQAEVLEKIERAKEMSQKEYNDLVLAVAETYKGMEGVSKTEIANFVREMKTHWEGIEKVAKKNQVAAKKTAGKVAKKAAKVAKKTSRVAKTTKSAVKNAAEKIAKEAKK